jgi:predicted Zn-dependent peptidase
LRKAKNQLRARLVFEHDSITNIAHQLGYFDTIASWGFFTGIRDRIEAVSLEQAAAVAAERLKPSARTVGWFEPLPPGAGDNTAVGEGASSGLASAV